MVLAELVGRWNLDLALWSVGLGIGVALLAGSRRAVSAPALAVLGATVLLWSDGPGRPVVVAAAGVAVAVAAAGRSRRQQVLVAGLVVALIVVARVDGPGLVLALAVGAGAVIALSGPSLPGPLPRPATEVLVVLIAVALWACVPDTEEVVAVGAATAGVAAVLVLRGLGRGRAHPGAAGMWTAPLLLLVWAAAQGWRGRPAGSLVLVVVAVAVAGWPLVETLRRRRRPDPRPPRALPALLAAALVGAVVAVAARTVGLASSTDGRWLPTVGLALATLVPWALLGAWADRRASPDPASPSPGPEPGSGDLGSAGR